MQGYRVLNKQEFIKGKYRLVPIRDEDRYKIMNWRNEQIYHLRQTEPLTKEKQDHYFENVVAKLFDREQPDQILFSFLKNEDCIGYGGLVRINWIDRNVEVSFIMNTELETKEFEMNWQIYASLIERIAFEDLGLKKLYVYAFDLRQHLYDTLETCGYFLDARLKAHCFFQGEFKDVVIYSKLNEE